MTDIIVRWDGTANTEWGRYLEAPDEPVRPAPPLRPTRPKRLRKKTKDLENMLGAYPVPCHTETRD